MSALLDLAWRNLGRNRRRTLITITAISSGLAMLVVASAVGDGMHARMINYGVANQAGHVVIHGAGYHEKGEAEITVPRAAAVAEAMRRAVPEARVVSRVFLQGLLTSPRNSVGVALVGVQPDREAEVAQLDDKLVEGAYLKEGDERGVVIGAALAKTLEVKLGDKVVLMTQRQGEIESTLLRVRGLFETGMQELDGFYGHMPLGAAQAVLGLGEGVHQVSLHLPDVDGVGEAARRARAAIGGEGLEVLPWQEALPELHQFVVLDDGSAYVFMLVIAIVVAMGILNTVLMSVLERTREFGVMLSLGMTPGRLGRLVLAEAALLGLVAVAGGVALGGLLSWPLIVNGLDYAELAGGSGAIATAGVPLDTKIYGDLSWTKVLVFSLISLGLTVLSSVYPIWKATRLEPVEAMLHQ